MNKRTRLIASLLAAVFVILAAAVMRFYVSVPEDKKNTGSQTVIEQLLESDGSGRSIFSDDSGNMGIAEAGRVVVAPEWTSISHAGDDIYIASKKIGGKMLCGCIDSEGNLIVPIIYKNISPLSVGGLDLYCAESNDDGEFILYDSDFVPYFRHPWQSYQISGKELILTDDMGEYTYAYVKGEDELMFKNASASGTVMGCGYSLDIYSRVLLSKLTVPMIEEMLSGAEKYIEYAYGGDDSFLTEISSGKRNDFSPLFEKESNIVSKRLLEISDIHIYELRSEGGIPAYEVSVTAYTEIVYTDETGEKHSMQDKYKAAVHFRCGQENYPELVSGKFELDAPKYPAPETEPTTEFFNNYETEPIY